MACLSRIISMFKPKATTPVQQFLDLAKACEDRVQGMLTRNADGSMSRLRINYNQCKYVAEKLKLAVQEAETFLTHLQGSPILQGERTNCLNEFKLLHDVACAVENFIQICCKDAWVTAAFLMPNMSHDVLSITFDLVLLGNFFFGNCMDEVEGVYRAEASVMTENAASDRDLLLRNLEALLRTTEEKTSPKYRLAEFLLRKLKTPGAYRTDIESLTSEEKCLGRGGYAPVYKSKWLGIDAAVKTFHGPRSSDFETEVSILGGLSHPNLASLFCYAEDDRECSIVMELMDCDLSDMIRNIMRDKSRKPRYPFSVFEAVDIMLQVGNGVKYLHEMKIVHRDLKAANILVKELGKWRDGESKSILVKVADFGLAKTKENSMTYSKQTPNTGTTRWMAPEVIEMRCNDGQEKVSSDSNVMKYPYQSDVYSFGMVCYEILTGRWPYLEVGSQNEVKKMILRGDRPELPEHCFAELKDLIERCWSQDASERPRFDEICAKLRSFRFQLLLSDMQQTIGPQVAIKLHGEAQIVVGLDIGTTFSGYAFAQKSNPEEILTFWDWPESMKPYCKTPTAIYYEPGDGTTAKVKSWGWEAVRGHVQDIDRIDKLRAKSAVRAHLQDIDRIKKLRAKSAVALPEIGTYLVPFKLHLASKDAGESSTAKLPKGFTVTQVIADYLREIGASIMRHLRIKFSNDISMADVQWCVTVPSNRGDLARKEMQVCMARAGLVRSSNSPEGSPHPLSIVLETDATFRYCHRNMPDLELKVGERLLVVDIGGATTDIVVQEWRSETPDDCRVKEVESFTGLEGGGMNVNWNFVRKSLDDEKFFDEVFRRAVGGPDFNVGTWLMYKQWEIFKQWEEIKCSFDDRVTIDESFKIQLPRELAAKGEFHKEHGKPPRSSYDELELTHADIKAIFESVVERILHLIHLQISRTANVKVILVVGGFGGSPYLLTKLKERFLGTVEKVMSPVQPGSAVCQGAVMLALNPGGL